MSLEMKTALEMEIIIVDNGSTDRSEEIITAFADKFGSGKRPVFHFHMGKNSGKGSAVRTATQNQSMNQAVPEIVKLRESFRHIWGVSRLRHEP